MMKRAGASPPKDATQATARFTSDGPDNKRVRLALCLSEDAARQVIRTSVPEIEADVEDAIIYSIMADVAKEALERQAQLREKDETDEAFIQAEAMLAALASMRLAEVACPMCDNGDLQPSSAQAGRFVCDSCALVVCDSACTTAQDVRARLGDALSRHAAGRCSMARPVLAAGERGDLRVDCAKCGDSAVIFRGTAV